MTASCGFAWCGRRADVADDGIAAKLRSVYGRGLRDGMKKAEEEMNQSKIDRAESGLNSMARKVLDAVPIQEAWTTSDVVGEMRRQGQNVDFRVVAGCLNTLCDQRLVREPTKGQFIRVQSKPILKAVQDVKPSTIPATSSQPAEPAGTTGTSQKDTLAKIADLSTGLRTLAAGLTSAAKQLDDVAIEVEERIQKSGEDGEQLRQLRALLKGIAV